MPREPRYYVYIMASEGRVIYVGVTGFLMSRVLRHKSGKAEHSRESIACIAWSTFKAF
jgi:predicted GIY-YIG superfamily endonuclease